MTRQPVPRFDQAAARKKVRMVEDAWNSRRPERIALACTPDSRWRHRAEIFAGRRAIVAFLTRKWEREREYRLVKSLHAFRTNRIAVRFQ